MRGSLILAVLVASSCVYDAVGSASMRKASSTCGEMRQKVDECPFDLEPILRTTALAKAQLYVDLCLEDDNENSRERKRKIPISEATRENILENCR